MNSVHGRKRYRDVLSDNLCTFAGRVSDDFFFQSAGIYIGPNRSHVIDRVLERNIDAAAFFRALNRIFDRKCEVAMFCHLSPRPLRLEIEHGGVKVGLTCADRMDGRFELTVRTAYQITNQHPARVSSFVLSPKR